MPQALVMGNWKMNGSVASVSALLDELLSLTPKSTETHCVVFPPSVFLPLTQTKLQHSTIAWGAQNVYPKDAGAFTGEVSGPMLQDVACRYVLVGHSERRHLFHEDEKFVAEKFHHVKDHDMIPVLCVGETQEQRDRGLTEAVLNQQLSAVTTACERPFSRCVIAYEPVWAIGTGQTATPEQAQQVHAFIRSWIGARHEEDARSVSIVYGGSVNEQTAAALFAMPDINGGLVGGASLNAKQFVEIVKCINS